MDLNSGGRIFERILKLVYEGLILSGLIIGRILKLVYKGLIFGRAYIRDFTVFK